MRHNLGIDLGNSFVRLSSMEEGILLREIAMVALNRNDGTLVDVGADAEKHLLAGDPCACVRPFRQGIVSRCDLTQAVLEHCLLKMQKTGEIRLLMSVPCQFDDIAEAALNEVASLSGVTEPYQIASPLAAMIGSGINPNDGCIAVDIGATQTNILITCRGQVLHAATVKSGGEQFDVAIAEYVRSHYRIKVSLRTAEAIKQRIGSVWVGLEKNAIEVRGKAISDDAPVSFRLSSQEMFNALEEPTAAILEGICVGISRIPPEFVNPVFAQGILLTGGGSMLTGLDKMISGVTGVAATVGPHPTDAVAVGLARISPRLPRQIKPGVRNITGAFLRSLFVNETNQRRI